MNFLELVRRRRSTRKYLSKPVPREAIDRCLEAARLAPSACNSQPWSFIIADKDNLKDDLAATAFSGPYSMNSFAKSAPILIVVITERSGYIATLGGYFKGVQYSLIDIGIACEHLVLQAEEEGLGTCWLGWFNEKAVKKVLGLPDEKKIDIIISMGYPAGGEVREKARKSLDEIRRYT
ncbi:MAG: nitroreductase family protein [Candidatus Omnitrophota bacterium]